MNTNPISSRVAQASTAGRVEASASGPGQSAATRTGKADVDEFLLGGRVHWGPILAGVVVSIAVLLFLALLGIALGISTPRNESSQARARAPESGAASRC